MLQGVFHVELKYTSRGPRLIEVNCRMGGGPVRITNLLVGLRVYKFTPCVTDSAHYVAISMRCSLFLALSPCCTLCIEVWQGAVGA
jgi:hypothetical protein